jgi:hypothetical protein
MKVQCPAGALITPLPGRSSLWPFREERPGRGVMSAPFREKPIAFSAAPGTHDPP